MTAPSESFLKLISAVRDGEIPLSYEPDFWTVFVARRAGEPHVFRVLGAWRQTYLSGEWWRTSSPVKLIERSGQKVTIRTESGSTYTCNCDRYGTTQYSQGVLEGLIAEGKKEGINVEALSLQSALNINWK